MPRYIRYFIYKIEERKREFVYRGAEVELRLIVLRTCTCGVISHLYRNKLDIAERGERGSGGEGFGGRSRGQAPPPSRPEARADPLSGGFFAARRGTIKCNFIAAPQAGKERFLCLFPIKSFIEFLILYFVSIYSPDSLTLQDSYIASFNYSML